MTDRLKELKRPRSNENVAIQFTADDIRKRLDEIGEADPQLASKLTVLSELLFDCTIENAMLNDCPPEYVIDIAKMIVLHAYLTDRNYKAKGSVN